jgi:hypothetical protein
MNKLFALPVVLVLATGSSVLMAIAAVLLGGATARASTSRLDTPAEML